MAWFRDTLEIVVPQEKRQHCSKNKERKKNICCKMPNEQKGSELNDRDMCTHAGWFSRWFDFVILAF